MSEDMLHHIIRWNVCISFVEIAYENNRKPGGFWIGLTVCLRSLNAS